MATFAYCNRCLNTSLNAQFYCKLLSSKKLYKFSLDSNSKNENVELELVKQAKLELKLKLDVKTDRVRSPALKNKFTFLNIFSPVVFLVTGRQNKNFST